MQQVGFLPRERHTQRKGLAGAIHRAAIAHQHAVLVQQVEQFARQCRLEPGHRAIVHLHPFGMRAGHAEYMGAFRQRRVQP
jgi:hypothetical protein